MSIKNKKSTPYHTSVITEEQLKEQDWRFSMYDKYKIPYGILNGPESDEANLFSSPKNIDRWTARSLIMQGKELPAELACRLLQYKEEKSRCIKKSE